MICYKDRTFCPFNDCHHFKECPYALTEQIKRDACEWWGNNCPPISVELERPDCWTPLNGWSKDNE